MRTIAQIVLTSLAAVTLAGSPALAAPLSAAQIVEKMNAVLWPAKTSTSTLTFNVTGMKKEKAELVARQAHKRIETADGLLTVIMSPETIKGVTWLIQRAPGKTDQWVYQPGGETRKIAPTYGFEAFLNTEYTFADLGLVDLHSQYSRGGEPEERDGVRSYKLEEIPQDRTYYARIVSWVDAESFAPVAREFYDRTNTLWKVETFDRPKVIDGVPTIVHRRLENKQGGASTEITVSAVKYGVDLPADLFHPQKLPTAASSPIWS